MNEININEIVKIEQMPKVFSQLEKIGELIEKKTIDLNELKCTDENKQEVKNRRTEINKTLEALEERRKEIKNKLLEPYDIFEEKYNKECKEKLQNASNLLKIKIDAIEEQQKKEKQEELELFANQHIEANNLQNIIEFKDIGLNITLSASMKSLKDQILEFVNKVSNDLECISSDEDKVELLYTYQNNGFDYANAVLTVRKKKEELKRLEELQKQQQEIKEQEQQVVENVEEVVEDYITIPKELFEDEEEITVQFTVTSTVSKIKALKEYLKKEEIKYE